VNSIFFNDVFNFLSQLFANWQTVPNLLSNCRGTMSEAEFMAQIVTQFETLNSNIGSVNENIGKVHEALQGRIGTVEQKVDQGMSTIQGAMSSMQENIMALQSDMAEQLKQQQRSPNASPAVGTATVLL